jgi:hypothetical protein
MDKVIAFDQSQWLEDFTPLPDRNSGRTSDANKVVNCVANLEKRRRNFNELGVGVVRSEGLEPPRFYSLPPQGSASTNSATSALGYRLEGLASAGSTAPM